MKFVDESALNRLWYIGSYGEKTKKVKKGLKKAGKEVEKSKRKDEKELRDDKGF